MRRVFVLLPLVLLAACVSSAAPQPSPAAPAAAAADVHASFPPHGIADAISIDAVDRLPLTAAVLIAPDGSETPASYIDATANPSNAIGQSAESEAWQNAVTGNNAFAAAGQDIAVNAAVRGESQLLAVVSAAEIPLPDPAAYRRDWQHFRIRLTFGASPAQHESRDIAAPAPPATATSTAQ
jgi:hypothetical protein